MYLPTTAKSNNIDDPQEIQKHEIILPCQHRYYNSYVKI